jgi:LysM repeat protein
MKQKQPPMNGHEVMFTLEPWHTKGRRSNNCYAYAVNDYETFRIQKSVPGSMVGRNGFHTYTHCKGIADRVVADNPKKVYKTKAMTKCRPGFYKIMMVVAPTNKYGNKTGDFHFYKQHSKLQHIVKAGDTYASISRMYKVPYSRVLKVGAGRRLIPGRKLVIPVNLFSHKQGWATGPLLKDSCGRLIKDPRKACRKYGYNYSKYCSSFCVKNKGVNVGQSEFTKHLPKFF